MREIKFRVWKTEFTRVGEHNIGEMAYDVVLANPVWNNADIRVNDILAKTHNLMQYTGLKDINGKEIYEGDIVKKRNGNYKLGKVAFDFGMFCFKSIGCGIYVNSDIFEAIHSLHYVEFDEINNYEVIGNIYENPELLES